MRKRNTTETNMKTNPPIPTTRLKQKCYNLQKLNDQLIFEKEHFTRQIQKLIAERNDLRCRIDVLFDFLTLIKSRTENYQKVVSELSLAV